MEISFQFLDFDEGLKTHLPLHTKSSQFTNLCLDLYKKLWRIIKKTELFNFLN